MANKDTITDNSTETEGELPITLVPACALGFHSISSKARVNFVNENTIAFPSSHHLLLYNIQSKKMEFLHPTKKVQSISCFQVSGNYEFIAVAEVHHISSRPAISLTQEPSMRDTTSGSNANSTLNGLVFSQTGLQATNYQQTPVRCISIYKTATLRQAKIIQLTSTTPIISMCFSNDNKSIALLEDSPTNNVLYWKINSGKLQFSSKCPYRATRVRIHPLNCKFVSVSGPLILKYWICINNEAKMMDILPSARDQEHVIDHLWFKNRMLTLTESGTLLYFQSSANSTTLEHIFSSKCHQPSYVRLECLKEHAKGFVISGSAGFFSVYECSDNTSEPFTCVRSLSVAEAVLECVAVSPTVETVVAATKSSELLFFSIGSIDMLTDGPVSPSELLPNIYQASAVIDVDICVQRPIIITISTDRTVRVWNVQQAVFEVIQTLVDEPLSLSLHPTGFFVLVAFKERIRMYQVLEKSLRQTQELSMKSCRMAKFSNGGHIFACTTGLLFLTYSSYTCQHLQTFSGHFGAVRSILWGKDDTTIWTASSDGVVYVWESLTAQRCNDAIFVVKQCQFSCMEYYMDSKSIATLAIATVDGKLRQITNGEEDFCLLLPQGVYVTCMSKFQANDTSYWLIVGTNVGSILIYSWPLTFAFCSDEDTSQDPTPQYEYFAHTQSIEHLKVSHSKDQLVTCAEDGSTCVFEIVDITSAPDLISPEREESRISDNDYISKNPILAKPKQLPAPTPTGTIYTDAFLLSKEDMNDLKAQYEELEYKYSQMKTNFEYMRHNKEAEWNERIRTLKDELNTLARDERHKYMELEAQLQETKRSHIIELQQNEANHVKLTQVLEAQYEQRLAEEIARYDTLSEKLEATRQQCEILIQSQDLQARNQLHAEKKLAQSKSKEQNEIIKRLHEDLQYNHVKFEEIIRQEETDYELQYETLRANYEAKLKMEQQNTALKQSLLSALQTKFESLKKKMQALKVASHARDTVLATEQAKIAQLTTTLTHYESFLMQWKQELSDSEKIILGYKCSTRMLENFRSVLHHKIAQLENDKDPMEKHMKLLEAQFQEMQIEFLEAKKTREGLEQENMEKDAKIKSLLHELKVLRQSALKNEYTLGEVIHEFTKLSQITNFKDLEIAVKDAYRIYVMHENVPRKISTNPMTTFESIRNNNAMVLKEKNLNILSKQTKDKSGVKSNNKIEGNVSKSLGNLSHMMNPSVNGSVSSLSEDALGYDSKHAVNESVRQVELLSRTIVTLRSSMEAANKKVNRIRKNAVEEGSALIEECNKLRKENMDLHVKIRGMENFISTVSTRYGSTWSPKRFSFTTSSHSSPKVDNKGESSTGLSASVSTPSLPTEYSNALGSQLNSGTSILGPIVKSRDGHIEKLGPRHITVGLPLQPKDKMKLSLQHKSRKPTSSPLLPFEVLEQSKSLKEQCSMVHVEELNVTIAKQKNEIERLQMQVQLLLDEKSSEKTIGPLRLQLPLTLPLETPKKLQTGRLRPLTTPSDFPTSIDSTFDFSPLSQGSNDQTIDDPSTSMMDSNG